MGCGHSKGVGVPDNKTESIGKGVGVPDNKTETIGKDVGVPDNKTESNGKGVGVPDNKTESIGKDVGVPDNKTESIEKDGHHGQNKTDESINKINNTENEQGEQKKEIKEIEPEENKYKEIDEHARKAPNELKQSSADLVNYMSSCTKDPEYLVRGFFIWISENIKYDVDGFFGTSGKMSKFDSQSVMVSGKSICAGYANVMEELCRQANIPVKTILGFSKGFGHSAEQIITEQTRTDHAWNAVQLVGKWYLLDSTWGSGNLTHSRKFEKKLDEFYFLTNPKHLISSHFPYMKNNMAESTKWQLLDKPVSLSDFSRSLQYWPGAFKLGARAVSHTNCVVEMKNELKMKFTSIGQKGLILTRTLELVTRNRRHIQENGTYGYVDNDCYILLVHPCKPGTYCYGSVTKLTKLLNCVANWNYSKRNWISV